MRSGYINLATGTLKATSHDSESWSATTLIQDNSGSIAFKSYYLAFTSSNITTSFGPGNTWYGFPLRCLSQHFRYCPHYNNPTTSLYFVRSGNIGTSIGHLGSAGAYGYGWSSMAMTNVWGVAELGAYYLGFDTADVYSSRGPTNRWYGFPLCCLLLKVGPYSHYHHLYTSCAAGISMLAMVVCEVQIIMVVIDHQLL